jgi:hypothetical protein
VEEVSKKELKAVLASLQKDKSPGPDGWEVEYFISFYQWMEEELLRAVEELRRSGKVFGAFNSTFLSLIPKKGNPASLVISGPFHFIMSYTR